MVDESNLPTPEDQASTGVAPRLLAVVEVDKSERGPHCTSTGCRLAPHGQPGLSEAFNGQPRWHRPSHPIIF